jgi:hypothetical protein
MFSPKSMTKLEALTVILVWYKTIFLVILVVKSFLYTIYDRKETFKSSKSSLIFAIYHHNNTGRGGEIFSLKISFLNTNMLKLFDSNMFSKSKKVLFRMYISVQYITSG